jgi:hypothetical protein
MVGSINLQKVDEYVEKAVKIIEEGQGIYAMDADELRDYIKRGYEFDKEMFTSLTEEEQELFTKKVANTMYEMITNIKSNIADTFGFDIGLNDLCDVEG